MDGLVLGAFTSTVAEPRASMKYAARWCLDLVTDNVPSFEEIAGFDKMGPVKKVRSLLALLVQKHKF
jgi:hypothetical protein